MPELTSRERNGRQRILRKYYGDGRWGRPEGMRPHWSQDWLMTKQRPRATTWAKSTTRGKKVHAAKYQIRAVHLSGHVQQMTVWQCGQHSFAPIEIIEEPEMVCSACKAKVEETPKQVALLEHL